MVTTFVVLGVVLLAVPLAVAIFIIATKLRQKKRVEVMKNAVTTSTTVQKGPNGRTVFETKATRPSPTRNRFSKQTVPASPTLPFTQQQAARPPRPARPASIKGAWQRLSRPFSMAAEPQEDQIELTKPMPKPHGSRFQEHTKTVYDGPVSPITGPEIARSGSSTSWNTVDNLSSSPVSPLSVTGMRNTTYQRNGGFHDIPLTPPTHSKSVSKGKARKKSVHGIDLGVARGFMPPNVHNKQDAKDFAKQQGKEMAKQAGHYAAAQIKQNIVDANKKKVGKVQLTQPPKAKTSKVRQDGWI
ncbi:hypothetical protein LTR64_005503 [Lithohypha guttulata]|uniref:uncharacterized protein n=1 Tax=Lithohypha guttulata TaxID=1690604 RepID=UPI00315DE9F9